MEVMVPILEKSGLKIDADLIVLPKVLHAPLVNELLEKGIYANVEKPLAPTIPECDQMFLIAEEKGIWIQIESNCLI
jgi:predicted dehydrogenase